MEVRTRFAPSPTGYLHIGGLRTALYAWLFARNNNGKFILRIEDTDRERQVEGAEELIYSTLKMTGLEYDEGPDVGGEFGPYVQSERGWIYKLYAEKLVEKGAAYYCFCTKERLQELREEKENKGEAYTYDKHCLSLSAEEVKKRIEAGESYVIRQNIPHEGMSTYSDLVYGEVTVPNSDLDDNVLLKSDGMPTYNLANVIDDHLMLISHVIRGVEYLSSTPKYNLLYDAMGWPRPVYIHLPPVMRDKQKKLSKRHGDASFKDFTDKGYLKEAILNYIAPLRWRGFPNPPPYSIQKS
jgi:glutamyl-tRNA synthetase